MTHEAILKDLKNKSYKPVYLLMGDEPYYIDMITDYIAKNVLNDSEKTFNQMVIYGKDTNIPDLVNTARRFPMMANHQVVILKEAQDLKGIDELHKYTENPLQSTILVLAYKYGRIAKNKKLYKTVDKSGVVLDTKKLYDNQVPDWITKYLKVKKSTIDHEAAALLADFLGTGLGKIVNELEKLIITLPENHKHITTAHIEKNIGISKDYNTFELQKALGTRNVLKANQIINHFAKKPKDNPIPLVLSSLYSYFNKIFQYHFLKDKSQQNVASVLKVNPFFVKEYQAAAQKYNPRKIFLIFGWLRESDIRSKGINNATTSDGDLLKELVFKILH